MDKKIAVFIDSDNISHKNYKLFVDEIKSNGIISIIQVYGDWSKNESKSWLSICKSYGLIPIQVNRTEYKNSTDLKMTCDISEILFKNSNIDIFYIISSDNDFSCIINLLKRYNKTVYGIGSKNANLYLQNVCHKFTKIETLTNIKINKVRKYTDEDIRKELLNYIYYDIISILEKSSDIVNLSYIKEFLERKYNFDQRDYGFERFKTFFKKYYLNKFRIYSNKNGCFIGFNE